jgi:hypothetical protein
MMDQQRQRSNALAAARMRRYRVRQKERAEHEAYILEQRVTWYADRLLAAHPAAAAILAEVPYDLTEALVDELKERFRAAAEGPPDGLARPPTPKL